jgi:HAD superfamily hydrolase (TIGR01490 family)
VGPTRRAAFFDVDGTLTAGTTLFRFLEYWLAAGGHSPDVYRQQRERLRAMTASGVPRSDTNRAYFTSYAGEDAQHVAAVAESWFRAELAAGEFFNQPAVDVLRRHQGAGDLVVLVSGSFPAPLDPIVRLLKPDAVLCTRPEVVSGRYTGRVHLPMIGSTKADAIRAWATAHRVSLPVSTSYGDHPSDLPMMESTGHSAVIGTDAEMLRRARREGWQLLPAAPESSPLALPRAAGPCRGACCRPVAPRRADRT